MEVSKPVMIAVIVVAVLIVGFIGFKSLAPKKSTATDQNMAPQQMMQNMPAGGAQGGAPTQPMGVPPGR
ncbi:MAG: hypothetical protein KBI47_08055 [Armatimonadetes bacterium]|jgi:Tfp pilus assembly protein PilV|nr:hypothetical protein [Armatimonadota bacterium]MDI9583342.1 hypothetical protein [Acidobacteriota bacterium]